MEAKQFYNLHIYINARVQFTDGISPLEAYSQADEELA